MPNSKAWFLFCLIALGCQASDHLANSLGDETARIDDRPVAEWVEQLRHGPVKELTQAGEAAMPIWIAAARDAKASRWVRHTFIINFVDQAWTGRVYMAMLDDPQGMDRSLLLNELAGNQAACRQVALPLMNKVRRWQASGDADQQNLVSTAIRAFSEMRPAPEGAIKLVKDLWPMTKKQTSVRWRLMEILGNSGPTGVEAVIDVCLQNDDAAKELWHFVLSSDRETLEAVIQASDSEAVSRRRIATLIMDRAAGRETLAEFHAMLVAPVQARLQDSDTQVRRYALSAIENLASKPNADRAIATLAKLIGGNDQASRFAAGKALVAFGEAGLPAIRAAAKSDNPQTRVAACSALSVAKPLSPQDTELLLELTHDFNPGVRRYAVYALGESEVEDPRIVLAMVAAMSDPATKDWATRTLGSLGALAEGSIPTLRKQLDAEDLRVRLQAADALWHVSHDVGLVLPIARAIAADDHGVTTGGYFAWDRFVDGKRIEQQRHYQAPLSTRAAVLLGEIGPAAKPAVGELVELLKHPNPQARFAAIRALGKIGPAASAAVPAIQQMIREDSNQQLIDILHIIDPDAELEPGKQ